MHQTFDVLLTNSNERAGLAVSTVGFLALGLVITYGVRMVRMLRAQARDPGELT